MIILQKGNKLLIFQIGGMWCKNMRYRRSQILDVGSWKLEVGSWRLEVGRQYLSPALCPFDEPLCDGVLLFC
jgi:hypothetical protein